MASKLAGIERHPLQPIYIVVQSPGLTEWLNLQLAKTNAIAANIHFITPNFLPFLSCKALGERYESGKKAEELLWGIHRVLGSADFASEFSKVASYYAESPYKQMQLSVKLSDLFDQYSLYRADDVTEWAKGKAAERLTECADIEEWQRYIWHKISGSVNADTNQSTLDNSGVLEKLKSDAVSSQIRQFFPSIQCFALSTLSPYHSQLLTGLSQHTEVNFFLLNPSPEEYWYDIRRKKDKLRNWRLDELTEEDFEIEGNDFLLTQGRLLKSLMHQLSDADPSFFNYYEAQHAVENKLLLQKLQKEIVENKAPLASSELVETKQDYSNLFALNTELLNDGSIQVSSHYSIYREVQGLYDYLLDKKQNSPDLNADEIAVVTPSLIKYAPFIKAVFDSAPHKLNYNLVSLSDADEHSPVAFIFEILNLSETEFTAEKALALLEFPDVVHHFGIRDKSFIRSALKLANIRWKIDSEKNASELHQVSWLYGLQRMVTGMLTHSEANILTDSSDYLCPVSVASPKQYAELLRFIHFVDQLIAVVRNEGKMKGIANCGNYLLGLIEAFLPEHGLEESANVDALVRVIHSFNDQASDELSSIDLKSYTYAVQHQFREEENKRKIFRGGVIFASPKDVRAIPFKVIAYLGLDSSSFPKQADRSAFDLMQLKPKFGDRSFKDNDRHLFIESFMCAKEAFYVSFLGKSAKTDTELPASVVVDELVGFVNNRDRKDGAKFKIVQHPLHPTSKRYALGENGLFTYRTNAESTLHSSTSQRMNAVTKRKPATLKDFIDYFKNAPKWYFKEVYNLSFYENDEIIEDSLLIETDGLQKHAIKFLVLEELLQKENNWLEFTQKLQSKGRVSLGEFGLKVVDDFKVYFENKLERHSLDTLYNSDNLRSVELSGPVQGKVEYFMGSEAMATVVLIKDSGKASEGKYLLELFIKACFLTKQLNQNVQMNGLFKEKDYRGIITPDQAAESLEPLQALYEKRYESLQFFHADSMKVILDAIKSTRTDVDKSFGKMFISGSDAHSLIEYELVFKHLFDEGYAFNSKEENPELLKEPSLESAIGQCWMHEGKAIFEIINAYLKEVK
jgi:exodeoxyribonuclease V gamma subunit